MRTTPENITELAPNEIFVYGSNTAGRNGKGAALTAKKLFGAKQGEGKGFTGRCYALPTLDGNLKQLSDSALFANVADFLDAADANPDLTFLLTRVGCGLAGYSEDYIKSVFNEFADMWPPNVIKPEGW